MKPWSGSIVKGPGSDQSSGVKYFDPCPPNTSMQALKTQALTQAYCPTAEIWKQDMLSNKT
jgi:hypothetical protein